MSEFSDFVLITVLSFLKSSPPFSIGLIIALFIYFGYLFNRHQIRIDPYSEKLIGMFFLFFYMGIFFYIFYFIFFILKIVPTSWLTIESDSWSTVVKVITFIYSILISFFVAYGPIQKYYSKFTYEGSDPISEYFFKLYEVKQKLWGAGLYMIYMTLFQWFRPFFLFVFAYIILLSNTSLITGLFVYSYIFVAFTFVAIDKGITTSSFRYAEIFLKDSKETEKGRIMSRNSDSFELLKKKKDGTVFFVEIPINNVLKMEYRELEEVDHVSNSIDK